MEKFKSTSALDSAFKRALVAAKQSPTRIPKSKVKLALTRYGYLVVDWPVVEDDLAQSGGGAVLLGEKDDLTISRGNHPAAKSAHEENLKRLETDAKAILGKSYSIVEKKSNLFVMEKNNHGR